MSEDKKARIGYLPEGRSLYDDMTQQKTLLFLGQLKGLSRATAQSRSGKYLKQVELWDVRERKIETLSRGMTQKAQFAAATMHEPELVIVDDPFAGLDPVNTQIIKGLIFRLRDQSAAVIMSTHQMNRVEEMCERIMLIDRGQRVLYGPVGEIGAYLLIPEGTEKGAGRCCTRRMPPRRPYGAPWRRFYASPIYLAHRNGWSPASRIQPHDATLLSSLGMWWRKALG